MNGAPAKPIQRHTIGKTGAEQANRVEHMGQGFPRLEPAQPIDLLNRTHGRVDDRTFALDEVERNAHRFEREQQVREQDGRVHLDRLDRLHGDLGGELRLAADLKQGVSFAKRAVGGHVAAGLSHEPDRRRIDRFAPAGSQKAVVHAASL